ncbi:hypothetical protein D9M71_635650 [compost metagenome]
MPYSSISGACAQASSLAAISAEMGALPVKIPRSRERSASPFGLSRIAEIEVGTSAARVIRASSIRRQVASRTFGLRMPKAEGNTTVAPHSSAPSAALINPPTWKSGNPERMRSPSVIPAPRL